MTHKEQAFEAYKKSIQNSEERPPIQFVKGYKYSHDGINVTTYSPGEKITQYDPALVAALRKERVPVASVDGKMLDPYENKAFTTKKEGNQVFEFLESLPTQALKSIAQAKNIDTKGMQKKELLDALHGA